MKAKQLLQRRILLSWFLLALIIVPAVGIIVWLFLVKAPPGNAVQIVDTSELGPAIGQQTPDARQGATLATILYPSPTEAVRADQRPPLTTPIPAQLAGAESTPFGSQPGIVPSPTTETIMVYVSGAVNNPGVYTLQADARVADAVNMAGGLRPEADRERINLAARITDEEHISIPEKGAPTAISGSTPARPATRASATVAPGQVMVNINTATALELEILPGIGPTLAARIVEYRAANGRFNTIEDLKLVPGIKSALFANIRDHVTVGP
jgi:competence protein ComEA